MSQTIAPGLLKVARLTALKFAANADIDRDDAVGWAYLAVAELAARRPLRDPEDRNLIAVAVKHRLIDWQRRESLLTRGERGRRNIDRRRVPIEQADSVPETGVAIPDPWVRDAIKALPAPERRAIAAVYAHDIHAAEYARRIERTESRVSQILKSAYRRLRELLSK